MAAREKKLEKIAQPLYAVGHSPNGFPHHFKGPEKSEMSEFQRRARNQAKRERRRSA